MGFICESKISPMFLSLSPRQTEISHSSRTAVSEDIFSWAERGGEGGEDDVVEKITKINKGIGHKFWYIPPSLQSLQF